MRRTCEPIRAVESKNKIFPVHEFMTTGVWGRFRCSTLAGFVSAAKKSSGSKQVPEIGLRFSIKAGHGVKGILGKGKLLKFLGLHVGAIRTICSLPF